MSHLSLFNRIITWCWKRYFPRDSFHNTEINILVRIQLINNRNTHKSGKILIRLLASTVNWIIPVYIKCRCTNSLVVVKLRASHHQKTHLWRWQRADCAGRYCQSLCEVAVGQHMHHQGALWPMMMKRKRRRAPDGRAPSLRDGGRMRRRTWMGDRSLSLCDGGSYSGLGPPQHREEAPQTTR